MNYNSAMGKWQYKIVTERNGGGHVNKAGAGHPGNSAKTKAGSASPRAGESNFPFSQLGKYTWGGQILMWPTRAVFRGGQFRRGGGGRIVQIEK